MPATFGPLVDAAWLAAHRGEVAVADVRWYPDGRDVAAAFAEGHVPGAVLVDLDADLSAPPTTPGGRHPLPSPAAFAATLGRLGLDPGTPVVAVDDAGGSFAARLWWMLRVLGRPVAVLDGGLTAWREAHPDEVAVGAEAPPSPVRVAPAPWPDTAFVDADDVDRLRLDAAWVVLDARAADRYAGTPHPLDPRPGHIPGAVSAPWAANVDPTTGRFRSPAELAAHYASLGVGHGRGVVASCGSGVTACHDLLALDVAGLLDGGGDGDAGRSVGAVRLFTGSWSAWAGDADRPVALGPEPLGADATDPDRRGTDPQGLGT